MQTGNGGHKRQRALIVDDDGFQREMLKEVLAQCGWTDVVASAGGQEALQAVAHLGAGAFDLILIDLYMPGMDGFEFMGQLAATGYRGAIIIASGQRSEVLHSAELVAQLRRFHLLGTVPKPVQKCALAALLSAA
jgi:CheY-like chemotaxis protein